MQQPLEAAQEEQPTNSLGLHNVPESLSSRPPPSPDRQPAHRRLRPPTLAHTVRDLRVLLRTLASFVPSAIRHWLSILTYPLRRVGRALLNSLAMVLHKRGHLASNLFYDVLVLFWKTLVNIFFREIRSRGAWKIPKDGEGAIIFVVAPHHNQFLDPLLLMSEVRRESGRRISFLVAEKSMKRLFIGQAARLMRSIPVVRAQDLATKGEGGIYVNPDDPTRIIGVGTSFTAKISARCQIMLPANHGNATVEVTAVESDTQLVVKKPFSPKISQTIDSSEKAVNYKILPYVDQTRMYSSVYKQLRDGGSIGIFPEGGSHDRTDLLPLKAGVSIMALGAMLSDPELRLRIVPVGLSYFHAHRFRSRAVVEFGNPIDVPRDAVESFEQGGDAKKKAIGQVMDLVFNGLKSVTVRAPDYETLMLIQATRRLYRPPGQHLTLGQVVELNKRFIAGYEVYKDEPRLQDLRDRVKDYNTHLRHLGLKDHQVERMARPLWKSIILLAYRTGLLTCWGFLALPGVVLNAPIFLAASYVSHQKAKEALAASTVKLKGNDVLATWKVLVALAGAPALYTAYALAGIAAAHRMQLSLRAQCAAFIAIMAALPMIGYSALRFGEVGMDVYKSLRPLLLSVIPGNERQIDKLRRKRLDLQRDISDIVNELGPQLFDDFKRTRIVPTSSPAPATPSLRRKRSSYGQGGQGTFLTHPLGWLDEVLFGWTEQSKRPGVENDNQDDDAPGYQSGYTSDEPDYDEVIHVIDRLPRSDSNKSPSAASRSSRSRSRSRSRSKSALDLTKLDS